VTILLKEAECCIRNRKGEIKKCLEGQWDSSVVLATSPGDLSSTPGTYMVEGKNQLLRGALRPLTCILACMHVHTHKHIHTQAPRTHTLKDLQMHIYKHRHTETNKLHLEPHFSLLIFLYHIVSLYVHMYVLECVPVCTYLCSWKGLHSLSCVSLYLYLMFLKHSLS